MRSNKPRERLGPNGTAMPRLDSTKSAGDLSKLRGRVLLGQRRTGQKVLTHREAADEDGLEPDPADQPLGESNGFRVVARDRDADGAARAVGDLPQPPIADPVERPHDAG